MLDLMTAFTEGYAAETGQSGYDVRERLAGLSLTEICRELEIEWRDFVEYTIVGNRRHSQGEHAQ